MGRRDAQSWAALGTGFASTPYHLASRVQLKSPLRSAIGLMADRPVVGRLTQN